MELFSSSGEKSSFYKIKNFDEKELHCSFDIRCKSFTYMYEDKVAVIFPSEQPKEIKVLNLETKMVEYSYQDSEHTFENIYFIKPDCLFMKQGYRYKDEKQCFTQWNFKQNKMNEFEGSYGFVLDDTFYYFNKEYDICSIKFQNSQIIKTKRSAICPDNKSLCSYWPRIFHMINDTDFLVSLTEKILVFKDFKWVKTLESCKQAFQIKMISNTKFIFASILEISTYYSQSSLVGYDMEKNEKFFEHSFDDNLIYFFDYFKDGIYYMIKEGDVQYFNESGEIIKTVNGIDNLRYFKRDKKLKIDLTKIINYDIYFYSINI